MKKELTSRERVLTALDHHEADRVPCWLGASPEWKAMARAHLGLPDDESLLAYLGDDFRRVFSRYAGPDHAHPTKNLLHPDATYRTPFGIERYGYGYGMPLNEPLKGADSVADIDAYAWPDPDWIEVSHIRQEALQYERAFAILGGEWSPFWHDVIDLLGFDELVYKMYDNPDVVDAVLTRTASYYLEVNRRIFEASGDAIDLFFIGNDFGAQSGPMVGPAHFRRFLLPHLKQFVDLGHAFGKRVILHTDGSMRALIPDLIAIGLDAMQSVQSHSHGMELEGLKRDFGATFSFMGGVDTQALIEGSAEDARQLTLDVLRIMKPDGGFIASPSHDYLLPETPVENVIVMYETLREHGAY